MEAVHYLSYSSPRADNLDSFLTAHRISKQGQRILREATEVTYGVPSSPALLCVGVALVAAAIVYRPRPHAERFSSQVLQLAVPGLIGAFGVWSWKRDRARAEEHGVANTRYYSGEDRNDAQFDLNHQIAGAQATAKVANFSPAQFENELSYQREVLNKQPSPNTPAIEQYLRDFASVREAVRLSDLGYVQLDDDLLQRLRAGTDLPTPRPPYRFELEPIGGQPDTVAAHRAILDYRKAITDRNWFGGIALGCLLASLVPNTLWGRSVQALCGLSAALFLPLAMFSLWQGRQVYKKAPWVLDVQPVWLKTVGLNYGKDYIREQACRANAQP